MNQRQWIPTEDATASNIRHIATISAVMHLLITVLFCIVGALLGQILIGVAVGFIVGAFLMRFIRRGAEASVLAQVGGVPVSDDDHARLINIVEGLCVVGGDQRPALRVVDAGFPIAMAVAMPGSSGTIIVSSGFVQSMGRLETEAVVAHLMARLRCADIALTTYLLAVTGIFGRIGLASVARKIVQRVTDDSSVLVADIAACQATRYPPAMISALEVVIHNSNETINRIGARSLWFATPHTSRNDTTSDAELSSVGFARPTIDGRIAVLKEI